MNHKDNIFKHFFGIPPPPGYNPEGIALESANIIHGENCDCCTPIKVSNKLDELRQKQQKESHKGRFKGVRAQRAKKQEQQQQKEADNWDPTIELDPEIEKREKEEID